VDELLDVAGGGGDCVVEVELLLLAAPSALPYVVFFDAVVLPLPSSEL